MNARRDTGPNGLPLALGAYAIWGVVPLYFHALRNVPPLELVGWRVILTLPLCVAIMAVRRQGPEFRQALRTPAIVARLTASSLLVGANWTLFVWAVANGHVLASSLGYYINPLVSVLLGIALLGERLSARQWVAVAVAAAGIALLVGHAADMLGIALALALSFGGYGFIRKLTPVGAVPGLAVETVVLFVPALGVVGWYAAGPQGSAMAIAPGTSALLLCAGVVTAVPLLLFAMAARRLDLSVLGFVQFLSPTLSFMLGVYVFDEAMDPVRLACFVLIWTAIALFSWDLLARRRATTSAAKAPA